MGGGVKSSCLFGLCDSTELGGPLQWANTSRSKCAWAQAYYQRKRQERKSHACALRCLGQRWLKILWRMFQTGKPYDEAYHTRNPVRHGSRVLALQP